MRKILHSNKLLKENGDMLRRRFHVGGCAGSDNFNPSMAAYIEGAYRMWRQDR